MATSRGRRPASPCAGPSADTSEQPFITFLRGGHLLPLGDREEPRPPFAYRFRWTQKEEIRMEQKRAYRSRCYPSPSQRQMLARTFGCARFVYNWGCSCAGRPTASVESTCTIATPAP